MLGNHVRHVSKTAGTLRLVYGQVQFLMGPNTLKRDRRSSSEEVKDICIKSLQNPPDSTD